MADLPPVELPTAFTPALEAALRSKARRKAEAMHSAEELQRGLHDGDWRVRHEVVQRLIASGTDDPEALPALLMAAREDTAWQVRCAALICLSEFGPGSVLPTLRAAVTDPLPDVRRAAWYSLNQLGENGGLGGEAD
jgi:HEAT repeat protein